MRKEYVNFPSDIPVTISYVNIKNYPLHWHDAIEILYVLKGSIKVDIDTDSYEIQEDEIEIVNTEQTHRIYSNNDNRVLIFKIDPHFFEKYYSDIENMFFYTNTSDEGAQSDESYDKLRVFLSIILCEEAQKVDDYDKYIEKSLVELLFHLLNNFHYLLYDNDEIHENNMLLERYHRISKYIYNNYNKNITLKDIANTEFLSTHYLSHEIKYATGLSFTDLLNLTRVEESVKLLLDTDKSLSEISYEIGFSHTRYFNKHFKAYYNCTPLQFRKKHKISEEEYNKQKEITYYPLSDSLEKLSYYLDDYPRFNYEDKIHKLTFNMNTEGTEFNKYFKEVLNVGDAFDLLLEDNQDIVEDLQDHIGYNYIRLLHVFSSDMGIFPGSKFFNWTRTFDIFEYISSLDLIPLIVLDDSGYSNDNFLDVIKSFIDFFNEVESFELTDLKFQFTSTFNEELKNSLIELFESKDLTLVNELYTPNNKIDLIYDTAYMLPFIIHNTVNSGSKLNFIKAFDALDRQIDITNEVFFGYPAMVNDKGIKKPSYYAYYFLSKLGDTLLYKGDGYILTKSEDEYQLLVYTYNDEIDSLIDFKNFTKLRGVKDLVDKKLSLNLLDLDSDVRITKYTIGENFGSSFNYWLSMGKPKRLRKAEKDILFQASYPKIEFKYAKKNTILNIQTTLQGYCAELFILKKV
ncbi:helix-turn-helix domain-containing protein [Clostridium perfringens]|uniref:helix-turn-helix domain-containing protein n=1 Tax=Clostridium perfringens TaxID=1502 RepID=UPI0024BC0277|nr:helix-turn-helix domain-containing protein [Clostridium perfringens]